MGGRIILDAPAHRWVSWKDQIDLAETFFLWAKRIMLPVVKTTTKIMLKFQGLERQKSTLFLSIP